MAHSSTDGITARPVARLGTVALFVVALFCSAALIFMLQPLFARLVTPLLGGSSSVWNTSMVFFQAALLGGYFYAHTLQRVRSVRTQVMVHLAVLAAAALVLPLAPSTLLGAPDVERPARWLLGVLTLSVGAPYMAASATAPLLQAWYARTDQPDASDPYFLYGASNLGSLLGLLAYPLLVEPAIGARAQAIGWSWAYGGVTVLVVVSGLVAARRVAIGVRERRLAEVPAPALPTAGGALHAGTNESRWRQRLRWLFAAAVPSGLLIAVTQHIVTDVASAPFLWVPPLVLYLLTFVFAFRTGATAAGPMLFFVHAAAVACVIVLPRSESMEIDVVLRLMTLFTSALVCHRALAAARPDTSRLTEFYNFVSLGGVIGGAATALVAPIVFNAIIEYPLLLAATFFFGAGGSVRWKPAADTMLLAGGGVLVVAIVLSMPFDRALLGVIGTAVLLNRTRPLAVAPLVVGIMVIAATRVSSGTLLTRDRTFFGSYRVIEVTRPLGTMHMLLHGSTMHGAQWRDSARAGASVSYYAAGSALHEAVTSALPVSRAAQAAFIGLGTGAMACVLRPGDSATFIEIDPAIATLARDPRYFTYLSACPRDTRVLLGDGRIVMERLPDASLDVILADAFSSDAIPAHLITREAIRVYLRALRPDGVLVLHVSNRHLAIANEAVRVAAAEGLTFRVWRSRPRATAETGYLESTSASAVVVTRNEAAMQKLGLGAHWRIPLVPPGRAWSDDFIDLVRALREPSLDSLVTGDTP